MLAHPWMIHKPSTNSMLSFQWYCFADVVPFPLTSSWPSLDPHRNNSKEGASGGTWEIDCVVIVVIFSHLSCDLPDNAGGYRLSENFHFQEVAAEAEGDDINVFFMETSASKHLLPGWPLSLWMGYMPDAVMTFLMHSAQCQTCITCPNRQRVSLANIQDAISPRHKAPMWLL
jgi:hypothetical protein